ncbi:hypothetical protein MMC09_003881 [Bachmanniomyces sp. S44760]|nr:hypothetical protein [Bachmanniomyces sp. S44760]
MHRRGPPGFDLRDPPPGFGQRSHGLPHGHHHGYSSPSFGPSGSGPHGMPQGYGPRGREGNEARMPMEGLLYTDTQDAYDEEDLLDESGGPRDDIQLALSDLLAWIEEGRPAGPHFGAGENFSGWCRIEYMLRHDAELDAEVGNTQRANLLMRDADHAREMMMMGGPAGRDEHRNRGVGSERRSRQGTGSRGRPHDRERGAEGRESGRGRGFAGESRGRYGGMGCGAGRRGPPRDGGSESEESY